MVDGAAESRGWTLLGAWPWVRLLRGIRLALDGRKLLLAVLGLVLLWGGWWGLARAFPGSADLTPWSRARLPLGAVRGSLVPLETAARIVADPVTLPARAFRAIFALSGDESRSAHALLATLWLIVVWGVIGGSIARIAVVQSATGERPGLGTALRFGVRKAPALLGAPLGSLAGVAFFAALCAGIGLLYRVPGGYGAIVAGALAFVPLAFGLVMTLILAGLVAGWPLMVATVATEGEDIFDALSRTYSYVYQRPFTFGFYVAVAWLVGSIGLLLVALLARVVIHLAAWGLSFGGGAGTVGGYFGPLAADPQTPAEVLHGGWLALVTLLAYGWVFSYFWSAAGQIYLLLRHEVDGTPFEDVDLPAHAADRFAPEPEPAAIQPVPSAAEPASPA